MASRRVTWLRGRGRRQYYYCHFSGPQNQRQPQHERIKVMPTDQFKFEIRVVSLLMSSDSDDFDATPLSHCSNLFIDCINFFLEGQAQAFLRPHLCNRVSPELLEHVTERVINEVKQSFKFHERSFDLASASASHHGGGGHNKPVVFPFVLSVGVVDILSLDEYAAAMGVEESLDSTIRMIPTSEQAIDSLKKFSFAKQCIICLEDFDDGDEILAMPCHHVFHQCCLLHWLHTSHACPLCRYSMPTATADD